MLLMLKINIYHNHALHWYFYFYPNLSLICLVLNWKIKLYHAICDMIDLSNSYWIFYVCHILCYPSLMLLVSDRNIHHFHVIKHKFSYNTYIFLVTASVQSVPFWFVTGVMQCDPNMQIHQIVMSSNVLATDQATPPQLDWWQTFPHSCHQSEQRVAQQK